MSEDTESKTSQGKMGVLSILLVAFSVLAMLGIALFDYIRDHHDDRQRSAVQANIFLQGFIRANARQHRTLPTSIERTIPKWADETWPISPYTSMRTRHILRTDPDYIGNFTYFQFVKGQGYGDVIISYVPKHPFESLGSKFETDLEFLDVYTDSHYALVADGLSPEDVYERLEVLGWKGLKEPPIGAASAVAD